MDALRNLENAVRGCWHGQVEEVIETVDRGMTGCGRHTKGQRAGGGGQNGESGDAGKRGGLDEHGDDRFGVKGVKVGEGRKRKGGPAGKKVEWDGAAVEVCECASGSWRVGSAKASTLYCSETHQGAE